MTWLRSVAAVTATLALVAISGVHGQDPPGAPALVGAFEGEIESGPVHVEFVVVGDTLSGTLTGPGIAFGLEGWLSGEDGYGQVHTSQGTAAFEAYVRGDLLGLYLFELDAAGEPVMDSVIELVLTRRPGSTPPGGSALAAEPPVGAQGLPHDPVIATGAYASLTQDNAAAFVEALEFVLGQVGYAYQFTVADRQEIHRVLAVNFPDAEQVDQVVLADARTIWERVKLNWPTASEDDQREFALGVLILAFGEETVAAWVGPAPGEGGGQALGGGGQCTTFEDCTGNFVDEQTWTNTFNSQGCWAAAGCSSFDPSTNSFDYRDY